MMRPLLTQRDGLRLKAKFLQTAFLVLFGVVSMFSQSAMGISACNCSNDPLRPDSTRFMDQVVITVPAPGIPRVGQCWEIAANSGLYIPGSDPLTLFPAGTKIPETPAGSGDYILDAWRLDGQPYSFTAIETSGIFAGEGVLTNTGMASNIEACIYPPDTIMGDQFVCTGQSQNYTIAIPTTEIASIAWFLSSGGVVTSGGTTLPPANSISIDWSTTPGTHTLQSTGTTMDGCIFDLTLEVTIEDIISLACNNNVNVSVNHDCEVRVTPDIVLEDMMFDDDSYVIEFLDEETGITYPNGVFGEAFIGKQLRVMISQICGGNSCWGYVTVEDKSVPQLACGADVTVDCDDLTGPGATGLPLPTTYTGVPVDLGNDTYLLPGYDNCGDAWLTWEDDLINTFCVGPFGGQIVRTWTVTDEHSGSSTCSTNIFVNRAGLTDLVYPPNYDSATGPNPSLVACGPWAKLPNGHPSPTHTGSPTGATCFNVEVIYEDTRIDICGDHSFKLLRRWIATDWCTLEIDTTVQLITVMDTEISCSAPPEWGLSTSAHECSQDIDVYPPTVFGECSNWDYSVSYKLRDENGDPYDTPTTDGVIGNSTTGYTITGLEGIQDSVWIVYTVFDECGNVSQCFTEVGFEDNEQPNPVCDLVTYVALNETGMAWATWETFDDGSVDNCAIERFEVRRMNNNGCSQPSGNEAVKFCCNDVGTVQMVQLTVFDYSGNSNFCMVEVHVQDNAAPVLTCPANVTVGCSSPTTNLSANYGYPTVSDVCGATITESSTENFTDCGNGTIIRNFTATDGYGNVDYCTQVITFQNLDPLNAFDINWPNDYTSQNGCLDSGIDPEDLPSSSQYPVVNSGPCDEVAFDYEDIVFQFVDEACYKILRNWTVVDWCQYNPFTPTDGIWHHTQVIKIMNSGSPVITAGCTNQTITGDPVGNCGADVWITAAATDDCTDAANLVWTYTIDEFNDGVGLIIGTGDKIDQVMPYGEHEICWTVEDDCGNETSCCQIITIEDNKPPTPYCLDGIVTVIEAPNASVTIWASDFDAGGTDNCDNDVEVSFSANTADKSRTFYCFNIADGVSDTIELQIYYTDDMGNKDFCITHLILQDNNDLCPDVVLPSSTALVSGAIYSELDDMVDNVEVSLMNEEFVDLNNDMTADDGQYAFNDLTMHENYIVEPTRDDDYTNGVSTLDLLLIQKHILTLQPLDSPYKIIAADVNNSESISAIDLIELRKLILGIYVELPANNSWRFVEESFTFNDETDPFPFNEKIDVLDLDVDTENADFIAVKIGDVNASAEYNAMQSTSSEVRNAPTVFNAKAVDYMEGDRVNLSLSSDAFNNVEGFQFTLNYDATKLSFEGATSDVISLDESNVALIDPTNGIVTISWNTVNALSSEDDVLDFEFTALTNGSLQNDIQITSELTKAEIYTTTAGHVSVDPIELRFEGEKSAQFSLLQNTPNPFNQTTVIGFILPEASKATLKVYDTTGRVIRMIRGEYSKGYNEISFDANQLSQTGVLYYQLETETHTASKKMIVIK